MFDKILIANRGEIACRVATTARRLGIRTVAVFSDADARARHVALCDEAWRIGPAPARESYLRGDEIIRVMLASGAQAVHPGYGFLSENAAFAQACADAGRVFIGPPPAAILAMGLKAESKRLMAAAGVPLVPGYHDADQDPDRLRAAADTIGYPVLIKASAGGGGKGMRVVERADAFAQALASCRREAAASFGNDAVLIERYLARPRHIEIQVFADRHGGCVHLFERDCSVQRRHQKVIEEAPAPGMTATRREAMGAAAIAAARAVGYVGAGTVEFIADAGGDFFFMEMNTRLQVEHPVTEMITGHDLVHWQLLVAAGEPLPVTQADLAIDGHAIEARIYAENPDRGFLPSVGTLAHLAMPPAARFTVAATTPGESKARVRIDAGVQAGDTITPHYDPMIAKLIVWGEDRDAARRQMTQSLARLHVVGPTTNIDFLGRLMSDPAFAAADLDTGLIERQRAHLLPPVAPPSPVELALAALAVLTAERGAGRPADARPTGASGDPWARRDGWRLGAALVRTLQFAPAGGSPSDAQHSVEVTHADVGYRLAVPSGDGSPRRFTVVAGRITANDESASGATTRSMTLAVELDDDGRREPAVAVLAGEALNLRTATRHLALTVIDRLAHAGEAAADTGRLTAPMPGKVIALLIDIGAQVRRGQPLLVMEAMKMEHTITAPDDGRIDAVHYAVGDQVAEGAALVAIAAPAGTAAGSAAGQGTP